MSSSNGATIAHQDSFGGGESDSLEYFIKFPTASHDNNEMMNGGALVASGQCPVGAGNGAESDYVFVMNGETSNIPIVLLLGWAGCQDKYLMKYSKIYEDRG